MGDAGNAGNNADAFILDQPVPPQNELPLAAVNPYVVHQQVINMFPDLDLTQTLRENGHMSSEGLASYIIDHMAIIPKKRGTKRKATETESPERFENVSQDTISTDEEDELDGEGELLVDKLLLELLHAIKSEVRSNKNQQQQGITSREKEIARKFLCDKFTSVKNDFVLKMLSAFNGALIPTAIACFFAENNFGVKLQKLAPNLDQKFWCQTARPLQSARQKKMTIGANDAQQHEQFKRYTELMTKLRQGEYASLITSDLKLSKQYNQVKWERTEPENRIECLVCFEQFAIGRMVFCNAPTSTQDDIVEIPKSGASSPLPAHAFCRGCVRGQAQAATEQVPLADGGVGLRCMVPDCKNPILYSEIRLLLSREIRKKLDERILEENIGMASLENLERCKRCNFAMQLEVDKYTNKVFDCLSCGVKICRLCERDWDDDHFGVTCEELDAKMKKEKKQRDLEKQLNEAVIRKCPRCSVAFMKDEGCNKMTCRCGMTQCYLCRESKIDYTHFCQHLRDPSNPKWKCTSCTKTCFLYEDASKKDQLVLEEIRKKDESERKAEESAPSTSSGGATNAAAAGPTDPRVNRQDRRIDALRRFFEGPPPLLGPIPQNDPPVFFNHPPPRQPTPHPQRYRHPMNQPVPNVAIPPPFPPPIFPAQQFGGPHGYGMHMHYQQQQAPSPHQQQPPFNPFMGLANELAQFDAILLQMPFIHGGNGQGGPQQNQPNQVQQQNQFELDDIPLPPQPQGNNPANVPPMANAAGAQHPPLPPNPFYN